MSVADLQGSCYCRCSQFLGQSAFFLDARFADAGPVIVVMMLLLLLSTYQQRSFVHVKKSTYLKDD